MQTGRIRKLIKEAVASERHTGNLQDAVDGMAMLRGVTLNRAQRTEIVDFIKEYVEHAPALLDAIAEAADRTGMAREVGPVLEAAQQYFLAPFDLVPDHLGLVGLIDDAYLTHSLIQYVAESYQAQTGTSLLPLDLRPANQFMRAMIGEPHASMLDLSVASVVNGPAVQQSLLSLINSGFAMSGPDPIWGNASINEIVDARLGAMGVI